MKHSIVIGKAHVYGDHIDTDAIIAGKYTKTLDCHLLSQHVLEDLDPDFRKIFCPGDILVAGKNFGCGSSREQAPLALKTAGVSAVIARYFARIFFRNAINIGLPVLEVEHHTIQTGNAIEIDLEQGRVIDTTLNRSYRTAHLPPVMLAILQSGGLVPYLRDRGTFVIGPTTPSEKQKNNAHRFSE